MEKKQPERNVTMQYFTFAWQLIAGLGLGIFLGSWIDKHIGLKTPMATWILPLLVLAGLMIKVIQDTSKK